MYHTKLHLKRGNNVRFLFIQQARLCKHWDFSISSFVKPLSLIYILRCCDDSIVNNNANKSNAASKRSQAFSIQKLLWKANSFSKKLTSVPHVIGSWTALVSNDMFLCGLYESAIYWPINHVGVCKDYAFLLSYG